MAAFDFGFSRDLVGMNSSGGWLCHKQEHADSTVAGGIMYNPGSRRHGCKGREF
jgi:hypothetical protein